MAAGLERADRVLAEREVLRIDSTTRERFYAALRAPATPSDALRRLMTEDDERYRVVG